MDIPDQSQVANQPEDAGSAPPAFYLLPGASRGHIQEAECLPGQRTAEMQNLFAGFEPSSDVEYPDPRTIIEGSDLSTASNDAVRGVKGTDQQAAAGDIDRAKRPLSFWRAVVLGGFPAATLAVGVVMMVGALAGGQVVANPYLALYLVIAGFGLGLTSWAALRRR